MNLVDEKGRPIRTQEGELTAKMLKLASTKLLVKFCQDLKGPFSPGSMRVQALRKSCGVLGSSEGGKTIKFRRYETLGGSDAE